MNSGKPYLTQEKVFRPIGLWTKSVHKLLNFIRHSGVTSVPMPLGFDINGYEILTEIKGSTSDYPDTQTLLPEKALITSAKIPRTPWCE